MGRKRIRKQKFFQEHPVCCFCGGVRPATTQDHVPPRACFPKDLMPGGFEFPSCSDCNHGTSKQDTIFGFTSQLLDFNEANRSAADIARTDQLREEIARRWPEALPDAASGEAIFRAGHIITPSPVAISVTTTPAVKEAMEKIGEKLAHALFYRETGKIMTHHESFFCSILQIQRLGAESLTDYFRRVLPDLRMGDRPNIKQYGKRFAYKSGWKPDDQFFVFAAQFGLGVMCWGMVFGPKMQLSSSNDALKGMHWRPGGCGLGCHRRSGDDDEPAQNHDVEP